MSGVGSVTDYLVIRGLSQSHRKHRVLSVSVASSLDHLRQVVSVKLGDNRLLGDLLRRSDLGQEVNDWLRRDVQALVENAAAGDRHFNNSLLTILAQLPDLQHLGDDTRLPYDPQQSTVFRGFPSQGRLIAGQIPDSSMRGLPHAVPPARYLVAELPGRSDVGRRIPLMVRVSFEPDVVSASLAPFDVPAEGRSIVVTVSAPGLQSTGDLEQELLVPAQGDSAPVRFGFQTLRVGLHRIDVRAFIGGTYLGGLTLELSVEEGARLVEGQPCRMALAPIVADPGEVTLQVNRSGDGLSFQLIGDSWNQRVLVTSLAARPDEVVERILTELRAMAAGRTGYDSPSSVRRRLAALGANLWRDVVPKAIKDQFWDQLHRITSFAVMSDHYSVPWELLYATDDQHDLGFLAEHIPVLRRVYDRKPIYTLPLTSVAFVVPPGSPSDADEEVKQVRATIGTAVRNRGVVDRLDDLMDLFEKPPGLLHFACHNTFNRQTGSVVSMRGGPVAPVDLELPRQRQSMAGSTPLVFFNACRTAGEIYGFTELSSWASQFMGAGAGGFIGTLWPVRSEAARKFAGSFYEALVQRRLSLGESSLIARRTIAEDQGDPTWLAYSVYGSPSATAEV